MDPFKQEALRLVSELIDAAHGTVLNEDQSREDEARAALLAHIQRGAAPEGDNSKRVLREVFALCEDTEAKCSDEPGDFARGRRFEAKGIARAIGAWYQEEFCGRSHMGEPAAPAPDHFRDAAKMVPAPAEVPMPEPVGWYVSGSDPEHAALWRECPDDEQMQVMNQQCDDGPVVARPLVLGADAKRYGDDREAAGYARGLAEALRAASGVGKFVGAGDGETRVVGSSAEAVQAIKQLQRAALRGEVTQELEQLRANFAALQHAIVGDTGASAILTAGRLRAELAASRERAIRIGEALITARDHIDMAALEISHSNDAQVIRLAVRAALAEGAQG